MRLAESRVGGSSGPATGRLDRWSPSTESGVSICNSDAPTHRWGRRPFLVPLQQLRASDAAAAIPLVHARICLADLLPACEATVGIWADGSRSARPAFDTRARISSHDRHRPRALVGLEARLPTLGSDRLLGQRGAPRRISDRFAHRRTLARACQRDLDDADGPDQIGRRMGRLESFHRLRRHAGGWSLRRDYTRDTPRPACQEFPWRRTRNRPRSSASTRPHQQRRFRRITRCSSGHAHALGISGVDARVCLRHGRPS